MSSYTDQQLDQLMYLLRGWERDKGRMPPPLVDHMLEMGFDKDIINTHMEYCWSHNCSLVIDLLNSSMPRNWLVMHVGEQLLPIYPSINQALRFPSPYLAERIS